MSVLKTVVDPSSAQFAVNREALLAKLADLESDQATAVAGGG